MNDLEKIKLLTGVYSIKSKLELAFAAHFKQYFPNEIFYTSFTTDDPKGEQSKYSFIVQVDEGSSTGSRIKSSLTNQQELDRFNCELNIGIEKFRRKNESEDFNEMVAKVRACMCAGILFTSPPIVGETSIRINLPDFNGRMDSSENNGDTSILSYSFVAMINPDLFQLNS